MSCVSMGGKGATTHSLKKSLSICMFHLPSSSYFFHLLFFLQVFVTVKLKTKLKIAFICMKSFWSGDFFSKLNHEDRDRKRRKHFTELPLSNKILCAFVTSYTLMPAVLEGIEVCQTFPLIWTCGTSSCFSKGMSDRQNSASQGKD